MTINLAIVSVLTSFFLLPLTDTIVAQVDEPIQYVPPKLATDDRPEGRRRGGSSRGNCESSIPLIALSPEIQIPLSEDSQSFRSSYNSVLSQTTEARPSFWFYVPYKLNSVSLQFDLQAEDNTVLYEVNLPNNRDDVGVVQIPLPENIPALQFDTRYRWFLSAECSPGERFVVYVEGWLDRVPLADDIGLQLAQTSPHDQAAIYASHGMWQDAITLLGEQYRTNPTNTDLASDWHSLLESVELEALAEQPLIDCCMPSTPAGSFEH
ncbi:MAG: DUF928 domain-containing protein [Cyanobacteria bacterium P01_H01_bin.105]